MTRRRAELALSSLTLIWGSTFLLVQQAVAEVSTLLFLVLRFGLAALALWLVYARKIKREGIRGGLLAGALLFAAYFFQTEGLRFTTASKSAFLTGLSIPLVPLASSLVYRTRPRAVEVAGIVISTFGMVLMTLPSGSFAVNRGDLLSFFCAVAFALHMVVVAHYSPISGFETMAVLQVTASAVLSLLTFAWAEPLRIHFTWSVAGAVLVTGLLATAFGFTVMAWAQKYTTATRSALIFSLEPVVAWGTSWLLLGERLPVRGQVGAAVILSGILLVEVRLKRT